VAADEATHLATAFAVAGFRHVVGTLWPVVDGAALPLAQDFYGHLVTRPGEPALALAHAVRAARARYPDVPGIWAGYVHIGP
jgi:CHAT domain-containing protein